MPGLVAASVREQCRAILLGDARLRDDPTPDAVHRTRIAVRRLRSTLRHFAHTLAEPAGELDRLDAELRWLAGLLSPVRDSDVLGVRLASEIARLPTRDVVGPVSREVRRALAVDRAAGLQAWREVRDGERYRFLMADLGRWFLVTPVAPERRVRPRAVLRRAERSVRRRLRRAADDAGLHRARKAAKRLRYAAELLGGEVAGAPTVARRAKRGQSRWGEHQDLVVASAFLRRLADPARTPPVRSGFTYGVLVTRMDRAADRVRRQATWSR
jgi:CHAD domain-containing protein